MALSAPVLGQTKEITQPCAGLVRRLDRLLDIYGEAGKAALAQEADPGKALNLARQRAMKGDAEATIAVVGITFVTYGRRDVFPVAMIRQVCNLAARHALPIHTVTCAYFGALNPLGDKDEKRVAVEGEIARFDKAQKAPPTGLFAPPNEFRDHMDALKLCLPRA